MRTEAGKMPESLIFPIRNGHGVFNDRFGLKPLFADIIMEEIVKKYFREWKKEEPVRMGLLPASGSHRKYYRICYSEGFILGVYNESEEENAAYISFARQFRQERLPVPELCHVCDDKRVYFVEDLGDATLFSLLPHGMAYPGIRQADGRYASLFGLYRHVIRCLLDFQTAGGTKGLDYSHVYPVESFDRTAMLWDLEHFKYFFLKLSGIGFSETALQRDFERLADLLVPETSHCFMYRDFQSRNIMIRDGKPWFIDFQGGRRGPLAYDVASLLFDAKADLPDEWRSALLDYYVEEASSRMVSFDAKVFRTSFSACVLMRILQAMGTYGLRGLYERKSLFLKSIPFAIRNLAHIVDNGLMPCALPEIERLVSKLRDLHWASFERPSSDRLTLKVGSFSYKQGLPAPENEHGGGFVFDCRFLPNPGRKEEYKNLTGRSPEVKAFLSLYPEVSGFLQNCLQLVRPAVLRYIERDFESLSLLFGCTGGQHRSVYCAEEMARLLRENFDVEVELRHWVHPE